VQISLARQRRELKLPQFDQRWHKVIKPVLDSVETPALVMDKAALRQKYQEFRREFSDAAIYYALKANPHPGIVMLLHELGCDFEISSQGELDLLLRLAIPPDRIISGNPTKESSFVKHAWDSGVTLFAFDSYSEIDKLAELAPGSRVCIRLTVPNDGSEWPLSNKFGVEVDEAIRLLLSASERHLIPEGITFHVGSQCTQSNTWAKAIEKSSLVWRGAEAMGLKLRLLNAGGGFPIQYLKPIPSTAEISSVIDKSIRSSLPEGLSLAVAPGRALVGDAGVLVTTVIATAVRDSKKWLYLDVGVFNGLMEAVGGIKYPMMADKAGPSVNWVLSGPTCDSFDVISEEVELPDLSVGDRVYIKSAGAYTTAYASHFDGFRIPEIHYVE
jgi:ornithine decarboxylase